MPEKKLYAIWVKLGVIFPGVSRYRKTIDLERTLIETAQKGKNDPRLLSGMQAWITRHHNLVSGSRLIGLIKKEKETSVLRAVLDSAVRAQPRSYLKYTRAYCRPGAGVRPASSQKKNLPAVALRDKAYILRQNFNLALRALWGPSVRTEIICYFLEHPDEETNARQIAREVAYSYEPVHSELTALTDIGLLDCQKVKASNANLYRFSPNLRPHFFIDPIIALGNKTKKR